MPKTSKWRAYHDDGRQLIVAVKTWQEAIDEAMEIWDESDINKVGVEEED